MTKSAKSVYLFSFYLFAIGLGLLIFPNQLLKLLQFPETKEVWIQILGILSINIGIYYFYAGRNNQQKFYVATVIGRIFFFLSMIIITLLLKQPIALAGVGAIDLIGAIWTASALKKEQIS